MEVAADVVQLDERRRLAAERLLAQLRRAPGQVERAVDRLLVGRVRQRLERRDVRRRARRAHERGPEPLRLGGDQLDRHALDRHPDRAPLVLLDQRDDLGQRGEARQHGARIRRGADHRQQLAGVAPPPHVAGRLAVERGRDSSDQLPGAVQQEARAAAAARPRGRAPRGACASVFGPIPGTVRSRPAAAASRSSSAVRTSSARASSTERFAPSPR